MYYLIRGYQEGEDNRYYKVVAQCKAYTVYDLEVRLAAQPRLLLSLSSASLL